MMFLREKIRQDLGLDGGHLLWSQALLCMGDSSTARAGVIFRDAHVLQSSNKIPAQPQTRSHVPFSSLTHHPKGES